MKEWMHDAVKLAETGVMSWRDIAKQVKKPKSTVSDYLRNYYTERTKAMIEGIDLQLTTEESNSGVGEMNDISFRKESNKQGKTHLVIPDTQVKPGVSLDYLSWIGKYIVRKQPDVIIHLADHADMPSLSSYDKGKRSAEGKRVNEDIAAAIAGMEMLLEPLRELQEFQRANEEEVYNPRMVLTLGNHEDRISRYVNDNPNLHGFLGIDSLKYEEFGWEVVPFLTPINIDGVNYCHYFPNVMTGKPLSGTAQNMLKVIGQSFTMGHRQTLDVTTRFLPTNGQQQWGLICGAAYTHEEEYKGNQGNHHWRGIVLKHNVRDGSYDPLFVSLDWLKNEYGE